jgi:hypothetical protein
LFGVAADEFAIKGAVLIAATLNKKSRVLSRWLGGGAMGIESGRSASLSAFVLSKAVASKSMAGCAARALPRHRLGNAAMRAAGREPPERAGAIAVGLDDDRGNGRHQETRGGERALMSNPIGNAST